MSLSIPATYGNRYEITHPLGEGAFSRTFIARDNVLQRDVALKVLRREHQSNSEFSARFEREAQAAARVSHQHVVSVFDSGREGDLPYIVMQYVDGRTLRQFARDEGPLTIEEVVAIGGQVLDGLAAIHDQGIVHRDIKPQNVLLDRQLVARVSDFGVAYLANDLTLTETGTTIGTAAYMAPEQATGKTVGPQADLYAVGVMLYELLTGRLPFRGDNPVQVMYRHVSDVPRRPRDFNRQIPIELEAAVLRALAKLPSERFPDARSMRRAITRPSGESRIATVRREPERFNQPPDRAAGSRARTRNTPSAAIRTTRQRQPRRRWALPLTIGSLLLAMVVFGIVLRTVAGNGDGGTARGEPTASVVPGAAGGVPDPDPTETPSPTAETPDDATQPAAVPSPTAGSGGPDTPSNGAPTVSFNDPFPVSAVPPGWQGGISNIFARDDFVAGGAYRRDDGVLYDRPAAHLYSQRTEYAATTVVFNVNELPTSHIGLIVVGMDDEFPAAVDCRIALNDNVIWQGASPFENEEWTRIGWIVGSLSWLELGENRLTIEVMATDGEFGRPPWILLNEATLYWD